MSAAATAAAPPPPGAPPSSPTTVVAVAVDGGDEVAAVGQPPAPAPVDGDPTSPPPKRGSFSRPTAAEHPFVDGRVEPGEPVGSAPPPVPLLAPPTATVLHLTATVCLALAAAGLAAFGVGTAVTARAWQQGGHGPAHGGPAVAALLLVAAALLGVTAGLGAAATAAARRPRGVHLGRSFVYAGGASGAVPACGARPPLYPQRRTQRRATAWQHAQPRRRGSQSRYRTPTSSPPRPPRPPLPPRTLPPPARAPSPPQTWSAAAALMARTEGPPGRAQTRQAQPTRPPPRPAAARHRSRRRRPAAASRQRRTRRRREGADANAVDSTQGRASHAGEQHRTSGSGRTKKGRRRGRGRGRPAQTEGDRRRTRDVPASAGHVGGRDEVAVRSRADLNAPIRKVLVVYSHHANTVQ